MTGLERAVSRTVRGLAPLETGLRLVRCGRDGDGGYALPADLLSGLEGAWSFGVGHDVSFELDLLRRAPSLREVRLFDPHVSGPPEGHPAFAFRREGIGPALLRLAGPRDLVKADVEHAEWAALAGAVPLRAAVVVLEVHLLWLTPPGGLSPYFGRVWEDVARRENARLFGGYADALEALRWTHVCYHAHANNSLPSVSLGGRTFPPLVELGFVRRDLAGAAEFRRADPGAYPVPGLDQPNKADRPDVRLPDWRE